MTEPFFDMPIVSVTMVEQMRLDLRKRIPTHEAAQYSFSSWEDHVSEIASDMVLKVQRGLYGTEIHENEVDHRFVPKDWWQHFKLRWFPRWLERRFPVQMTRIAITLKHCHICPHQDIPLDASAHTLFLLNQGGQNDVE